MPDGVQPQSNSYPDSADLNLNVVMLLNINIFDIFSEFMRFR